MSKDLLVQVLTTILVFTVGGIASLVVYIVRLSSRWATMETKLGGLIERVEKLVQDKESTHRDMLAQMRSDRDATNQRLRWLEEHLWKMSQ